MKRRSSPPNPSVIIRERISVSLISCASLGMFSLCNLCVLCVSVVFSSLDHRDTENTEVAQRRESSIRGLTGDVSDDFVKFARAFTNVLHRDALVVAVHAFVFLGGRVNRRPAVSHDAELPVELAFSITAEHLGCDN